MSRTREPKQLLPLQLAAVPPLLMPRIPFVSVLGVIRSLGTINGARRVEEITPDLVVPGH